MIVKLTLKKAPITQSSNFKKQRIAIFGKTKTADWIAILAFLTSLVLLIAGFSLYLFWGVKKETIFLTGNQDISVFGSFDEKALKNTIKYFDERAKLFESGAENLVIPADPSIPKK